ncbi:MAG TPA: cell division protein ZapA [Sphingomonadaceae bacterium]
MSDVTLAIGGRSYRVACADGEEAHIRRLGSMIDEKLAAMGGIEGQAESRLLLFAALLLADEVFELKQPKGEDADFAPQLETLATRLENVAAHLEA